jgi:P27 family predicted phage terminase small subunit
MRGRKPLPSAIHDLNGNPSKLDMEARKAAEPKAPKGRPPLPKWLGIDGKKAWKEITSHLQGMGTLAISDGAAIAMIAQEWAIYREAMSKVNGPADENGGLIVTVNGQPQANPFLNVADKSYKRLVRLLVEFGLTPSSRSRISIAKTSAPASEGSDILAFIGKRAG